MQNDHSIATMMLDDGIYVAEISHGKKLTRLANFVGHKVDGQIEYSIKQKVLNEKATTAIGLGISVPIMVASTAGAIGIAASTKGIATPLALAGLAAGTWAANQVGEAVTGVFKNQFHKKRMRNWLHDYPEARQTIDSEAKHLQLTVTACDSVRRAVDHFQKASGASVALSQTIAACNRDPIRHCSEVVDLLKKEMKFLHEVRKAELYLLPAIDLAIYLKATQQAYRKAFVEVVDKHKEAFGLIAYTSDHRKCGSVCYRPVQAGIPKPTRRVKGAHGNGDDIVAFCKGADEVQKQIDALIELRGEFAKDLLDPDQVKGSAESGTKLRFQTLVADAARYYDSPGVLKRMRHYVGNSLTRKTNGEVIADNIARGLSFGVAVGGSFAGSAFSAGVSPLISEGVVQGLQNTNFNVLIDVAGDPFSVAKAMGDATASIPKAAMNKTIEAGAAVTNLAVDIARGLGEAKQLQSNDDIDGESLTQAGKTAADDLFKKAARHLQLSSITLDELAKEKYFPSCTEALERAAKLGEFVHHMRKVEKHLTSAMALVGYLSARIGHWNELEGKSFAGVRQVSLAFLGKGCSTCACRKDKLPNLLQPCYGPGSNLAVPKRRIVRV